MGDYLGLLFVVAEQKQKLLYYELLLLNCKFYCKNKAHARNIQVLRCTTHAFESCVSRLMFHVVQVKYYLHKRNNSSSSTAGERLPFHVYSTRLPPAELNNAGSKLVDFVKAKTRRAI